MALADREQIMNVAGIDKLDIAGIVSMIVDPVSAVRNIAAQFQERFQSLVRNAINNLTLNLGSAFFEFVQHLERQADVIAVMLTEAEWTPTLHVPLPDLISFADRYSKMGIEAIRADLDVFLVDFYDQPALEDVLIEWESNQHIA